MNEQITTTAATAEQIMSMVLNAWTSQAKAITGFFAKYSDEAYAQEVAPGRNRAIYLLGHLVASNDGLLPLLGFGDRLYPHLEAIFLSSPDKSVSDIPSLHELKDHWATVNSTLAGHFTELSPAQWLERHTRVSAEDFALDPKRNRLTVLLSRTTHMSYHLGQLTFLAAPVAA
jgi:DinB superfamily